MKTIQSTLGFVVIACLLQSQPTCSFSLNSDLYPTRIRSKTTVSKHPQVTLGTNQNAHGLLRNRQSQSTQKTLTSLNLQTVPDYTAAIITIGKFFETAPYTAALISGGVQASAADFVAQRAQRSTMSTVAKRNVRRFEFRRNFGFVLYGGLYQGCVQQLLYNKCLTDLFGAGTFPLVVAAKVLTDLFVFTPFLSLPSAYVTKAVVFGKSPRSGIFQYFEDVKKNGLLLKNWLIWGPVQCLTFSIVPKHLRISFVAVVSFFWLVVLSMISSTSCNRGEVPRTV